MRAYAPRPGEVVRDLNPQLPEPGGVGCENCHGPSAAHVANPKTRTPFTAADQCVRCHDQENSPKFNYAEYWPRVKHGLDPRASIQGEHQ